MNKWFKRILIGLVSTTIVVISVLLLRNNGISFTNFDTKQKAIKEYTESKYLVDRYKVIFQADTTYIDNSEYWVRVNIGYTERIVHTSTGDLKYKQRIYSDSISNNKFRVDTSKQLILTNMITFMCIKGKEPVPVIVSNLE